MRLREHARRLVLLAALVGGGMVSADSALACTPYEPVVQLRGSAAAPEVDAEGQAVLLAFAAWTMYGPGYGVRLVGHSDTVGTEAEEMQASLARARAVRDHLLAFGVLPDSIEIEGRGAAEPPYAIADEVREPRANRVQLFSQRPTCEGWITSAHPSPPAE